MKPPPSTHTVTGTSDSPPPETDMESGPRFQPGVFHESVDEFPSLLHANQALRDGPAAIKAVKRGGKAPRLDVVAVDFMARRIESARISARSGSDLVAPRVREYYVSVEVFLPETAWVDGAAGVRQAYADLFLVMDLGGRRTGWDLDSSWILELLDLPQGSDTSQVVELASEPIASLFRRGRSTAPAYLPEARFQECVAALFGPEGFDRAVEVVLGSLSGDECLAFARSWARHFRRLERAVTREAMVEEFGEVHEAAREALAVDQFVASLVGARATQEQRDRIGGRHAEVWDWAGNQLY